MKSDYETALSQFNESVNQSFSDLNTKIESNNSATNTALSQNQQEMKELLDQYFTNVDNRLSNVAGDTIDPDTGAVVPGASNEDLEKLLNQVLEKENQIYNDMVIYEYNPETKTLNIVPRNVNN